MDGTLSGYYHQPSSSSRGVKRWVFYFEGGGECTTQEGCFGVLNSTLGSSIYFSPTLPYLAFYMNDIQSQNPDFFDWNHVHVPYCSQDLFSGQVTKPSNNTFGLYFAGHNIFAAIVRQLMSIPSDPLSNAQEILLSGGSAGGIGVWMNVGFLADLVPSARVVAAPVAGFYFYAYPYTGVNHTSSSLADFRPEAWPTTYALWQSFVDRNCLRALADTPWACLLANYSFPYIQQESYVVEAQTDEVVLVAHDWVPQDFVMLPPEQAYLAEWANNMTQALQPVMNPSSSPPRSGAFNPACFIHTNFLIDQPLIRGIGYLEAFGNWYYQRTGPDGYQLQDNCGIMCNPTCPPGP